LEEGPVISFRATVKEAVERLRWRGHGPGLGDSTDPATIAKTLAYLFGFGAILLLATLLVPGTADRQEAPLVAIAGAAVAFSAFLIGVYDRLPIWFLRLAPAMGTVLVGLVVCFAGAPASAAYAMYFSWVVIAAGCFFSVRATIVHGIFALAVFALALEITGASNLIGLQLVMTAGSTAVAAGVMCGLARQLRGVMSGLEDAARTDPLTGVPNRRALAEAFERELARSRRTKRPVGLVVLDLDHFKRHNDAHGHPSGDSALQRCTYILMQETRGIDTVARIGGEEFAVIAPEADTEGARATAERLRRALEREFAAESPALTVSCGVASSPANGLDRKGLLAAADRALYDAKARGRNRVEVCAAGAPLPSPAT
jgi:diguanylate cyclase (GGDEF)-like protein